MKTLRALASLAFALPFLACDSGTVTDPIDDLPSKSEIDDAKIRVGLTAEAINQGRAVLELLGIMPVYTCGEPRSTFAGKVPKSLETGFAGAAISLTSPDPSVDLITVAFPAAGTDVHGQKVTGNLLVRTSGGEDRFTLGLDASNVQINGTPINAMAGYGTCGDSTDYWARTDGSLKGGAVNYSVQADVSRKAGLPLIGNTSLLIDGFAYIIRSGKTDEVALTAVDYEVGKVLPRSGTVVITTSSNHTIAATFDKDTPIAGQVRIKVDSKSAVTVPLPGF